MSFNTAPGTGADTEPGWYPDPTQRYEFRYYNGERWTADVAQHSNRYVDPIGPSVPTFVARPSRGMAITAFVFSLCSLAIAWIPIVFVLGAGGAITAVILGIIVLRRSARDKAAERPKEIGQGMAMAAICISVAALALCVVGFWLTQVVLREVDEFVNPGPHDVRIDSCEDEGGHMIAEGSIRNRDDETHGYTITIAFRRDGERVEMDTIEVDDVAAGETAEFATASTSVSFTSETATCTVENVFGPTPLSY